MRNVLIISYAFPPLSIAGTFRPMKFSKYLSQFGWNPSVITVDGRGDLPRDDTLLRQLPADIDVMRVKAWGSQNLRIMSEADFQDRNESSGINGSMKKLIRIKRDLANFINNMISIPDPLIYWVPSVITKVISEHQSKRFDAIITTSPPHSTHFAGLYLSRHLDIPWLADFRDPWIDNVYFKHYKKILRRSLETRLEKVIVSKATFVIANTGLNRDKLIERYGPSTRDRIVTITNGFDRDFIDSIEAHPNEKFTICHTGVYYSIMQPYFFFESIAQWINSKQNKNDIIKLTQILMVGTEDSGLRPMVDKLGLQDCVYFIPRVSHEKALSYAKSSDLLLVNLGFGDRDRAQGWIPLKLYDYLGCKRPILGILPEEGAASKLIQQTNSGHVVSKPDHEAVAGVVEKYFRLYRSKRSEIDFCPNTEELYKYDMLSLTRKLSDTLNESLEIR